jgi:NADH dehydrogenase (ubiquinone) 1 alpha subcomplex subunit 1
VGAVTAMGGVQYLVHHAFEGKPKAVGADNFDRLLKYRDERLKDEAKVRRAMDQKETLR